ncbi:nucleoside hydrolase [Paracoccus sp. JM45]|uniref:nucleoside hydrolase n=1 Tax=Paracoccus sp. JM45 TaxID=2283626 RepID=UPI000E6CE2D6|nr:nucleoside hydrolase [Paracoccus sp. JM45]RJE79706.1 nucleoside hydrolase [Paracoccus sp. JM45]
MNTHKVIFDTDPGVDDALALYYLIRHPQIQLLGVTTVFGNAPVTLTTRNARFLLRSWGADVPVHAGAAAAITPDMPDESFPVHIHGENGMGDIDIPDAPVEEADTAAQFIIDQVRAHPGKVRILAVGRMTNLARALQIDPEIADLVGDVVIMGGAFRVAGNITPAAEANIWGDPLAADRVFGADWHVTAIPLDLTTRTMIGRRELQALADKGGEGMQLVADLSQDYIGFYAQSGYDGMVIHDCCAAVFLTDPDLFRLTHGQVRVLWQGIALGLTIMNPQDRKGPMGAWDDLPVQAYASDGDVDQIIARIGEICTAVNG